MDQPPQLEDAAANAAREDRRADVQRRIDAAVLRGVAVRSTYRRRKHGSALVEYVVRHAYEVGVGRMYAASAMQWFVEAVGFELRKRTMLPEDARRLSGLIDAPRDAFVSS